MTLSSFVNPYKASPAQVRAYEIEVLADSPWGYWKMNEASGSFLDSSGNGRHLTADTGTPLRQQTAIADGLSTSANFQVATQRYVRAGSGLYNAGQECSFEFWLAQPTQTGFFWGEWAGSQSRQYMWEMSTAGVLLLNNARESSGAQFNLSWDLGTSFPMHVVVTVDAFDTVTVYRNGSMFQTGNTWSIRSNSTGTMFFGRPQDTFWGQMTGRRSDIALYRHALVPARVAFHYAAGIS